MLLGEHICELILNCCEVLLHLNGEHLVGFVIVMFAFTLAFDNTGQVVLYLVMFDYIYCYRIYTKCMNIIMNMK